MQVGAIVIVGSLLRSCCWTGSGFVEQVGEVSGGMQKRCNADRCGFVADRSLLRATVFSVECGGERDRGPEQLPPIAVYDGRGGRDVDQHHCPITYTRTLRQLWLPLTSSMHAFEPVASKHTLQHYHTNTNTVTVYSPPAKQPQSPTSKNNNKNSHNSNNKSTPSVPNHRLIDKIAHQLYKSQEARYRGSWKLQLATSPPPSLWESGPPTFKPVPIFAFAMIDEDKLGNGIG
ncbi:hypothetical protein HJC23_006621 [Cyclotella cryptica]|uniref:Uncharacterized protein n=1 Tax=Cyclotella cryptica TaxID=29204 RepID=A0ABD3QWL9_9STRA